MNTHYPGQAYNKRTDTHIMEEFFPQLTHCPAVCAINSLIALSNTLVHGIFRSHNFSHYALAPSWQ